MNENSGTVVVPADKNNAQSLCTCVHAVANILQVPSVDDTVHQFAARTLATGTLVLVSLKVKDDKVSILVNCEKMVIGTMLLKDIKASILSSK